MKLAPGNTGNTDDTDDDEREIGLADAADTPAPPVNANTVATVAATRRRARPPLFDSFGEVDWMLAVRATIPVLDVNMLCSYDVVVVGPGLSASGVAILNAVQ